MKPLFIFCAVLFSCGRGFGPEVLVPLRGMFETAIINEKDYANKFRDVDLNAEFTSPSGRRIPFWGFFDGDGTGGPDRMDVCRDWQPDTGGEISGNVWKLRFMPDEIGTWTYEWAFSDDSKSGYGSFECISRGARRGVLNVDWDGNVRYLRNAAGPFFAKPSGMWTFIGITYDINECKQVYDKFIQKGFNMLMQQGNFPVWPRPRFASTHVENNGGVNDPHILVWYQKKNWTGDAEKGVLSELEAVYDTDRMNLFTWKRMDQHYAYLAKRGVYFIPWQGFNIRFHERWPLAPHLFPREKYDWFIRYAMARLAPYYNLIWNNTWESTNGAKWLWDNLNNKGYDPWRRFQIIVEHTTTDLIDGDRAWHMISTDSDRPDWVLEDNRGTGLWFVERFEDQADAMKIEWKFLLNASVALPVEYKGGKDHSTIPFTQHLTLKGMDYIAIAFNYLEKNFEFWHPDVRGHNELVSGGGTTAFCLARPGHEYLIYKEDGGALELNLTEAKGEFSLSRFNPFTGISEDAGCVDGGKTVKFSTVGDFHIFHLKKK